MVKERAKKMAKKLSEIVKNNDGKKVSAQKIATDCGYSESYAKSGHFKKTEVFNELMDRHLPNSKLILTHEALLGSAEIQHYVFPAIKSKRETTERLEEQPNGGKLKRKQKPEPKYKKGLSEAEIKMIVESVPGCRLIYVKDDIYMGQVAFFQSPDNRSRKDALDLAYKLKGSYSPEKHAVFSTGLESLSDEELDEALKDKDFILKRYREYGKQSPSNKPARQNTK